MENKILESRLLKESSKGKIWINYIEEIEQGFIKTNILEIPDSLFFASEVTNTIIINYLKKLGITIKQIRDDREKIDIFKKCKNTVHDGFKKQLDKETKKNIYLDYKYQVFSIDDKSFVICPECKRIMEIK